MGRYYEYEERISGPRDRSPSPERPSAGGPGPSARRDSRDSFVRETMTLEPPPSSSRPRSVPPPHSREMVPSGRSPSPRYYDDDSDRSTISISRSRSRRDPRDRSESPMSKARNAMQDNFTNSTAGIGASLIGAIAGGYAGRTVSDRVSDKKRQGGGRRRRSDADKDDKIRIASTLLGAAIGGLGANALTNRFEDSRERTRDKQSAWEDRYGPEEDLPHYDSGRRGDMDHRNGRGALRGREDDEYDDYDYVYDRRDDRRMRRQDSDDSYRYGQRSNYY